MSSLIRWSILVFALLAFPALAAPRHGSGGTLTTDNIAILFNGMSHGQWLRITNTVGNVAPALTSNEYDADYVGGIAQHSANLTQQGGITPSQYPPGVGPGPTSAQSGVNLDGENLPFSRPYCDVVTRNPPYCVAWGGGHTDSGTGPIYGLDLNAAVGSFLASGQTVAANWTLLAHGCRWLPATVSGTFTNMRSGGVFNNITAVGNQTGTTINVSAAPGPNNVTWIGGTGIPDFTYITGGTQTSTTWTLNNSVTVTNGETINYSPYYICSADVNGHFAPTPVHSYYCGVILQGLNTYITGGYTPWWQGGAPNDLGAGVFDLGTNTWSQSSTFGVAGWCNPNGINQNINNRTNPVPDYATTSWLYLTDQSAVARCTNSTAPSCSNITAAWSSNFYRQGGLSVLLDPSPTLGTGHRAFYNTFSYTNAQNGYGFVYIDDIDGTPTVCTTFSNCGGTFSNNLTQGLGFGDGEAMTFSAGDNAQSQPHVVEWEGTGQLTDFVFSSGGHVATMTVETTNASPAPNCNSGSGADNLLLIDMGATYHHGKFAFCGGQIWAELP